MPSTREDYEVVSTIGTGSYGTCKKIRRKKDGKILVWKEMDYGTMSEAEKQMLVSEVNLLRELRHEHIVKYHDRIIDRSNSTLFIIMEYCQGGDLASLISKKKKEGRNVEEVFVWKICCQIISALKECHSRKNSGKTVLHRDLKPANVFLDSSSNVKLGDFGLARVLNHDTSFAKTFVGTPYYMSPEQMNCMSYNEKSDIWSLGCLLYELCALRPPFTAANQRELATKICTGRFMRIPYRYSDDLNRFIACMLRVEEHKRPTIDELLEHPVIQQYLPDIDVTLVKPENKALISKSSSNGSSNDEGYSSRIETLRKKESELKLQQATVKEKETVLKEKESNLRDLERKLKHREKEIETRERNVLLREQLADDKLSRADRLVREYKDHKSASTASPTVVSSSALCHPGKGSTTTSRPNSANTPTHKNLTPRGEFSSPFLNQITRDFLTKPSPSSADGSTNNHNTGRRSLSTTPGCLVTDKAKKDSPHRSSKKVSFTVAAVDKENDFYNFGLDLKPETYLSKALEMDHNNHQLYTGGNTGIDHSRGMLDLHQRLGNLMRKRTTSTSDLDKYDFLGNYKSKGLLGFR